MTKKLIKRDCKKCKDFNDCEAISPLILPCESFRNKGIK